MEAGASAGDGAARVQEWRQRKALKNPDQAALSAIEKQYILEEYGDDGLFEDYAEMSVQFGYATLFAPACPIAPVMALVNNYVELRVDAMKLCYGTRRPIPKGAADIGTWYAILSIMATAAVTTNGALLAFTSKLFNGEDATYTGLSVSNRVWIFIIFEHSILILRSVLEFLIPDVPEIVEIQAARTERITEKIINLTPDDADADDLEQSDMEAADISEVMATNVCTASALLLLLLLLLPNYHKPPYLCYTECVGLL